MLINVKKYAQMIINVVNAFKMLTNVNKCWHMLKMFTNEWILRKMSTNTFIVNSDQIWINCKSIQNKCKQDWIALGSKSIHLFVVVVPVS